MELPGTSPLTFLDVLDARAGARAESIAFTFLRDGEVEAESLTYAELRARSLAVAARLTALGGRGQRAILLYPQGVDFIVALFGCLYAGVLAVPTSMPHREAGLEALRRVVGDAGARWILSTRATIEQLEKDFSSDAVLDVVECIDPEESSVPIGAEFGPAPMGFEDVVLLQYTSGSTGAPRGVAVTHQNLVENHREMQRGLGQDESTIVVSWLPMYHDMGLGTVLMTVWAGGRCIFMSPGAFVQKPRRWLAAISRYRGTSSLAPDFAYALCTQRLSANDRMGLDLSSWRVAGNGSEPVHAATIERFVEAFGPHGFRRGTFHPGYGLAEATCFVTSAPVGEEPVIRCFASAALERGSAVPVNGNERGQALVSCGRPWLRTRVCIVDPETRRRAAPRRVGEIWVAGGSVAAGYWGRAAESRELFAATTLDGEGPFLRTGDLGFIDEGELFVTGRHKDLIIVRGRNHYPQDIESTVAASDPALVRHGCAAFSVDSEQGEQLVIVQEVERAALRTLDTSAVVRRIRAAVSDQHGLTTHAVVLLKPWTLPRTTSGKVRRKTCRQAFLDRTLPAVASWQAPSVAPEHDAAPDTARRDASARADRLIEWLRRHAADLISSSLEPKPRSAAWPAVIRNFSRQGLLGMQVEPRHGGLGLGHADTARVLEQLAAFDFALSLFVGLNQYLGVQPVAKYATAEVKALLLPGLAHGQELAAFAFEEPASGAQAAAPLALAKADGDDHFRLFGTKYLDGVAQDAAVISVFARHDEPPGISAFVISERVEGLRRVRDGLTMSVLGLQRDTVVLDGVRVGRDNLLGALGSGLEIAREATRNTRLAMGAACIGGMKRCAQLVSRGGFHPGPLDGKLTPNPTILSRLGSVTARVTALECLVHRIARALDAGHAVPAEAFAASRILGPDLLLRSIEDLLQLGVNGGYAETDRIASLYRDAGLLRSLDALPEVVAELTGAAVMEGDGSLRLLLEEVFCTPELVRWIDPMVEAVRDRMASLSGPLARRAQRWGHTRAGELATWLVLLAAVHGSRGETATAELERARAWAHAQFQQALASVRSGTPSETAALDAADVAATFAAYSRTIGDVDADPTSLGRISDRVHRSAGDGPVAAPSGRTDNPHAAESARRELRSWIMSWLARRLQMPVSDLEAARSFADHGVDSVVAVELVEALSTKLGHPLDPTLLWNFATIDAVVAHLAESNHVAAPAPAANAAQPAGSVESRLEDEIARLERELKSRP